MLSLLVLLFVFTSVVTVISGPQQGCFNSLPDRCFSVVTNATINDWNSADRYCASTFNNGGLASIRSRFEENFIVATLVCGRDAANDALWIGGYCNGGQETCQWLDGSAFAFNDFPHGYYPGENSCIQDFPIASPCELHVRQWKAVSCAEGTARSFVCEFTNTGSSKASTLYTNSPIVTASPTLSPICAPSDPCKKDVLLLIDGSSAVKGAANFQATCAFLANLLVAQWSVSREQTEAAVAVYDSQIFQVIIGFTGDNIGDLEAALQAAAAQYMNDPPSMTNALQQTVNDLGTLGQRPCTPEITILLTASSDQSDVNSALPFAAQLKATGNLLIVLALGPNADPNVLAAIASDRSAVFHASDYSPVSLNQALASQINTAASICFGPTSTACPPSSCRQDIVLLFDSSSGLGGFADFQTQFTFATNQLITNWAVSRTQIEVCPTQYTANDCDTVDCFEISNVADLKAILFYESTVFYNAPPGISGALNTTLLNMNTFPYRRPCVPQITVLFTSTSDPTDVRAAMPAAAQLRASPNALIIVALGRNANVATLTRLASPDSTFAAGYSTLPDDTHLANEINLRAGMCNTSVQSTIARASTQPPTTGPTPLQAICGLDITFVIEDSELVGLPGASLERGAVARVVQNYIEMNVNTNHGDRIGFVYFASRDGFNGFEYNTTGVLIDINDPVNSAPSNALAIANTFHTRLGGASDIYLGLNVTYQMLAQRQYGTGTSNLPVVVILGRGAYHDGANCCDPPTIAVQNLKALGVTLIGVVLGKGQDAGLMQAITGRSVIGPFVDETNNQRTSASYNDTTAYSVGYDIAARQIISFLESVRQSCTTPSPNNCKRDVLFLIDSSNSLIVQSNYQAVCSFLSALLVPNWIISSNTTATAIAIYDSKAYQLSPPFGAIETVADLQNYLNVAKTMFFNDPPSITNAFQWTANNLGNAGQRPDAAQFTILLTASSNPADIASAVPLANRLKVLGNTLIVVAVGPTADLGRLTQLASGRAYGFKAADYTAGSLSLTLANQINAAAGICTTTTTS